jgi:hypothetical protein
MFPDGTHPDRIAGHYDVVIDGVAMTYQQADGLANGRTTIDAIARGNTR